jgi:hypothetical protein
MVLKTRFVDYKPGKGVRKTLQLTINVGWGVANGFTNLSGNSPVAHIHGPTAAGGVAAFTQNAGFKYGFDSIPGFSNSASSGSFIGVITIIEADEAALRAGQFYLNYQTLNLKCITSPSCTM